MILNKFNKTIQVRVNTPYKDTENIEIKEVVKQGPTYRPIMCCASTAKVNEIGEKVICKYGIIEIGIPVFIDNTAALGDAETMRKGLENCRKWKQRKNIQYGLKKTKYTTIITGGEKQEQIEEDVKEGNIKYIYLLTNYAKQHHAKHLQLDC